MSHRPGWQCSKCRHQLGEVVDGALRVWAPAPLVASDLLAVGCPRCGVVNVWTRALPTRAMAQTLAP